MRVDRALPGRETVLFELAVDPFARDPEHLGRPRLVAAGTIERPQDHAPFDRLERGIERRQLGLELERFDHLPGARLPYARWQEFDRGLERLLEGVTRAALDYQPGARIPYLSRVDAGFVERVRALGVEVVSAARPLLHLQTWTAADLAAHRRAAAVLHEAKDAALAFLRARLPDDPPRELEVQRVMLNVFAERGVTYDHPPIVAFGATRQPAIQVMSA